MGDKVSNVLITGLNFHATTIFGQQCLDHSEMCVTLNECRFLYAPGDVHLEAKLGRSRAGGLPITIRNNIFEFGEGSVMTAGGPLLFEENWMAFNAMASLQSDPVPSTVVSFGYQDVFKHNSFLYNAGREIKPWTDGCTFYQNLFVGTGYKGRWADVAAVHVQTGAQVNVNITSNWFVGPSPVKPIRFDTSGGTTYDHCGHDGTVSHNVWVAHEDAPTIKCDNHTITHNTGNRLDIITAWAKIDNMNGNSRVQFNVIDSPNSRGGKLWPGHTLENACPKKEFCNTETLPAGMDQPPELSNFCAQVQRCWETADTLLPPPFAWDFRPKDNSSLLLHSVKGNDNYIGAYPAGAKSQPGRTAGTPSKWPAFMSAIFV